MKAKAYNFLKFLVGWPLSIGALYFVVQMVSPKAGNFLELFKNTNLFLLSLGIFCFVVYYFIRSFIWYRLLKDKSYEIPYKQVTFLWAISEFKRYIPGKFWFILGRTVAFSNKGVDTKVTAKLLVVELEIFAISAVLTSLLSVPFLIKYLMPDNQLTEFLPVISPALALCLVIFYVLNRRVISFFPNKFRKILNPILPDTTKNNIIFLLFTGVISQLFYGLGNYFIIVSIVFLDPQLIPQLIGFFSLSFLLGFLSFFTPAGLGVREGITAVGLAKILTESTAGVASLFSRIILIISEIIFISLSFIFLSLKSKYIFRAERIIKDHPHVSILFVFIILYCLYFTVTSFARYDNFYTGRFDLGNMAQTVWNTSQGRIFIFSHPDANYEISRLGYHADFILVLFAPLYLIWSDPKLLLLVQVLVVGSGALFIYLIAVEILKSKNLALTFAFVYLINPSIQRANIYDFHAVTLATCFLLGAYYFYLKKRYLFFSMFAFLAAMTKEEIWLITAIFGIFIFVIQKKRIFGAILFAVSVTVFYYLIWHAIPAALGSGHFALSFFSEFGDTPTEVIKTAIFSPDKITGMLFEESRLDYLHKLMLPVGYLAIFSPSALIFALPDLSIGLLSSNEQLRQIYYQYTAPISPFIFIAAIAGLAILRKNIKLSDTYFVIYLLFFSILGAYYFGPLPGAKGSNLAMFTKPVRDREFIDNYLNNIPQDLSVSASNNAASHLSNRQRIYTIPIGLESSDIVIFLLTNRSTENRDREMLDKLKLNKNYYQVLEKDKFIVFKRKRV